MTVRTIFQERAVPNTELLNEETDDGERVPTFKSERYDLILLTTAGHSCYFMTENQ